MNSSEDMLKAVQKYAARGWVVHPLSRPDDKGNSPGKKPLITGWQNLTQTPEDIGVYIKKGGNLGLVCGKVSNVTVLDLDNLFFLEQVFNGFDLKTLRSKRTEGRGHIYFQYNPDLLASRHHDLGIEVLSDGNNAVIPPSVHAFGDVYKWSGDEQIIKMPQALEDNLKTLFQTEAELKLLITKCRTCFRSVLKEKKNMHGGEGREYMLAVCTDLKAAGATDTHALMFARIVYGTGFNEDRTLQEWRKIDPAKTWTCAKLKEKVPAFLDFEQCDRCRIRREDFKGKTNNDNGEKAETDAGSGTLLKYIERDGVELFQDEAGKPFVKIKVNDTNIVLAAGSKQFSQWLSNEHFKETKKVLRSDALKAATNLIEGKCCFEGKKYTLHNRVCWHEGAIWYDLGDGTAVKIIPGKWEIIQNPPILFRRYSHQQPHDVAKIKLSGGDIKKIFKYIHVDKDVQNLIVTTAGTYFIPGIAHAVLLPYGEQGSAKSTLVSVIKELVDPSMIPLVSFPTNNEELMQQLDHNYFVGFDNVSGLSTWQSDVICRAVTGAGSSKRALYSDEDDVIFKFKRCIGLNGINIVATKPDLLDRSIAIECQRITEKDRKTESRFWTEFEKDKGEIMGAIFDIIATAMTYKVHLPNKPRMADFALWGSAISHAAGYEPGAFIKEYTANIRQQDRQALSNNVVGDMIMVFMETRPKWEGEPSALFTELRFLADAAGVLKVFPKAPNSLIRAMNTLKTTLGKAGICFTQPKRIETRKIELTKKETKKEEPSIFTVDTLCRITITDEKYRRSFCGAADIEADDTPDDTPDDIFVIASQVSSPLQLEPVSALTHQLRTFGEYWQKHHGVINTANLKLFCKDFKDTNHPTNDHGYTYTVNDLEQIVSRVFNLTPAVKSLSEKSIMACVKVTIGL